MDEKQILCVSNAYLHKYYLGSSFAKLPTAVKEELQIACVLFTEKVGGILTLAFDDDKMIMITPMTKSTVECCLVSFKKKKKNCLQALRDSTTNLLKERYERL